MARWEKYHKTRQHVFRIGSFLLFGMLAKGCHWRFIQLWAQRQLWPYF